MVARMITCLPNCAVKSLKTAHLLDRACDYWPGSSPGPIGAKRVSMSRTVPIKSRTRRSILSRKVQCDLSQSGVGVLTWKEARFQSCIGTFRRYNPFIGTLKERKLKEVRP